MSRVFVCGLGAVSPAGWGAAAMREALARGEPLPVQPLERPGWAMPLRARLVPPPAARLPFLVHPRLRRTSPITHYAAAAALEAAAGVRPNSDRSRRLGVIVCLQSGLLDPLLYSVSGRRRDLELHRALGLVLHDDNAWRNLASVGNVLNPKRHQVAATQFAIDGQVEQRQFPCAPASCR